MAERKMISETGRLRKKKLLDMVERRRVTRAGGRIESDIERDEETILAEASASSSVALPHMELHWTVQDGSRMDEVVPTSGLLLLLGGPSSPYAVSVRNPNTGESRSRATARKPLVPSDGRLSLWLQ